MKPSPALRIGADGAAAATNEALVEEAPLAIEITYQRGGAAIRRLVATTMRTPGADEELVLGFLFGEGLVRGAQQVVSMRAAQRDGIDTLIAELDAPPLESVERISRGLITSACGFCGRTSLATGPGRPAPSLANERWDAALIARLPDRLRREQPLFASTGACHGAALAVRTGELHAVREDVGRHNAVDKVIGAALRAQWWQQHPADLALILSGRAGYELIQKAAAAGCGLVVAVGAPSSLAVKIAGEAGLTLIGFVRDGRFNVYTGAARLHGTG